MFSTKRNIVITGFMGTGKTSVGRELARRLGRKFVDMDEVLVKRLGTSIGEVFRQHGEGLFRRQEARLVAELGRQKGLVIATGGGTVLLPENRQDLSRNGELICLESAPEVVIRRLEVPGDRPLILEGKPRERIYRLLELRRGSYAMVPRHIDTSHLTVYQVVERILSHLGLDEYRILVHHGEVGYQVFVEQGILANLRQRLPYVIPSSRCVIVTNPTVKRLWGKTLCQALKGEDLACEFITIPDGERHKNLTTVGRIYDHLVRLKAERNTCLVSFGGGVVSDLVGFAASTYMRGVPVLHIPTTLLAQGDAAIGGKTGFDHPLSKNLIGTFHHPVAVFADPLVLRTLPLRHIRNGLAEFIRSALIGSEDLLSEIERNKKKLLAKEPKALESVIRKCARIKAEIVSRDPYEKGLRRKLNLGHTIGHALETMGEYRTLLHGEAVGIGLVVALRLAVRRAMCDPALAERVVSLLKSLGLPTELPKSDEEKLWNVLLLDKKTKNGRPTFVLPRKVGEVETVEGLTRHEVIETLKELKGGKR